MTRSRPGRVVLALVLPVGLVALWWWTSARSTSFFYPPLSEVVTSLQDHWLFEQVGSDLVPSLTRFTAGYVLAVAVGVAAGTVIGLAPRVRRASQPTVEFLRSIPPPLMLPVVLVVIGIGDDSKVALIVLGSLWPVLLNTIDGVRGVDPLVLDMARSFGLGRRARITRVVLPAASPKIVVGMRTALSIGLILMIISEMQASSNGLGFQVLNAQRTFDSAGTYAGVIVIGVVGLVVNLGFLAAEARIMRWHRGSRGLLDEAPVTVAAIAGVTVLEIDRISKTYGAGADAVTAIDEITFTARPGELLCIVGPSGCGKTTLLRCVSGLMPPTSGAIRLDDRTVSSPPRSMALVFQDYSRSLLPWMTIHGNVVLPLKAAKIGRDERERLATEALASVGLGAQGHKYPWQLSGGMQQRAAIARALAYQAEILLLDEPFASVDAQTRADLEDLLLDVWGRMGLTVLLVTHDIDEAVYLADRIVVLSAAPTRVRKTITVDLPRPRDQIATKELPEFARLRASVFALIKAEGGRGAAPGPPG